NVRTHGTGTKQFHHHVVGELTLAYESMDLRAEPDLTLTIYAAEPASPTAQALALLASWAATAVDSEESVRPL
ncbi:transcriptional regulator, partial [Micromonospora lupini]